MIDNTHVVVLRGTGASMVPVPEMESFADRFDFTFIAHEKGDANRSGRVERPFHHFENNFLVGRSFESWQDLNAQALDWCRKDSESFKRHLRAKPVELYATERLHLKPLPIWIPDPYLLHSRVVDSKGYINLQNNRYSVPVTWVDRQVEVQETWKQVTITLDSRNQVEHEREIDKVNPPGGAGGGRGGGGGSVRGDGWVIGLSQSLSTALGVVRGSHSRFKRKGHSSRRYPI
jgi:hypothetical protein